MLAPLLAEVIADPRAIAPRLVYADALLEAGDPRGELIQVQCALEGLDADDPARDALEARASDLLALHEPAWTRELRERCELHDHPFEFAYRRGFVESARLRAARVRALLPILAEQTPLRELRIGSAQRVEDLAEVPGLVELEGLSLHGAASGDALVRAFASWPHRGRLRSLQLEGGTAAARAVAGAPALAGLERLSMSFLDGEGVGALAAAAHLASLRALALPHVALDGASLEVLGRSPALSSLEVLEIGHVRWRGGRAHPEVRAGELPALARLRELRCHRSAIGASPALELALGARGLEILDLDGVPLGEAGARSLLGGGGLPELRHLDLSATEQTDEGFAAVIDALEVPGLRRLACGGNALGSRAAAALAASRALDGLQQLFLARCPLDDAGARALAASEHLPALRVLDLARTSCGRGALAALGAGELGARLVSLDLGHNGVGDRELGALLEGRRLERLERLVLDGAALSPAGVRALAAAPLAARLRSLSISELGSEAAAQLARAELPELRTLVVGDLDDRAAALLAASRSAPWLQHVVIRAPGLTDDGALALANAVELQRITWLELDAPRLGEAGQDALRRRFGHRVGIFAGGSPQAFSSLSRRF